MQKFVCVSDEIYCKNKNIYNLLENKWTKNHEKNLYNSGLNLWYIWRINITKLKVSYHVQWFNYIYLYSLSNLVVNLRLSMLLSFHMSVKLNLSTKLFHRHRTRSLSLWYVHSGCEIYVILFLKWLSAYVPHHSFLCFVRAYRNIRLEVAMDEIHPVAL